MIEHVSDPMKNGRRLLSCIATFCAVITIGSRGAVADSYTLHPPAIVLAQLDALKRVDHLAELPETIRNGRFEGADSDWTIADPGERYNSTDVADPALPFRRLIFGACTKMLCLVHYEHGGIAWSTNVAAFERQQGRWKLIWHAYGSRPLQSLAELRALLRNQSKLQYDDECKSCVTQNAVSPARARS